MLIVQLIDLKMTKYKQLKLLRLLLVWSKERIINLR